MLQPRPARGLIKSERFQDLRHQSPAGAERQRCGRAVPQQGFNPCQCSRKPPPHRQRRGQHQVCQGPDGWRIRCDQVGTDGGYEFEVGSNTHTVMAGEVEAFNITVDVAENLKVEHIGMLSQDWGALVITRLF